MAVTPPISQFQPNPNPYGSISTTTRGASLLGVDPNMLTSNRLDALLRSDNPIVRRANDRATSYALARGGGLDSGSMAYNAELGAMDALTPIASEEAGMYGNVARANQDAMNQENIERMGNQTQLAIARGNQSVERGRNAELAREFNVGQQNRLQQREWDLADQDTQARASARSQFFNQAFGAIFSDPSYWRDPQGAMGMLNEYGTNFDSWFANNFPEYFSGGENNTPAPPTPYQGGR